MDENVIPVFLFDEAIAFCVVEPLDFTLHLPAPSCFSSHRKDALPPLRPQAAALSSRHYRGGAHLTIPYYGIAGKSLADPFQSVKKFHMLSDGLASWKGKSLEGLCAHGPW
jgi:hypothetical protein